MLSQTAGMRSRDRSRERFSVDNPLKKCVKGASAAPNARGAPFYFHEQESLSSQSSDAPHPTSASIKKVSTSRQSSVARGTSSFCSVFAAMGGENEQF